MSHPTRILLALFACLAVAGVVEASLAPGGEGTPSHLARISNPAPAPSWVAALR